MEVLRAAVTAIALSILFCMPATLFAEDGRPGRLPGAVLSHRTNRPPSCRTCHTNPPLGHHIRSTVASHASGGSPYANREQKSRCSVPPRLSAPQFILDPPIAEAPRTF